MGFGVVYCTVTAIQRLPWNTILGNLSHLASSTADISLSKNMQKHGVTVSFVRGIMLGIYRVVWVIAWIVSGVQDIQECVNSGI